MFPRAERRQSTRLAGSPDMKRRYCQKFSPGPARRRPCKPWMTVAATRRASSTSRGMVAARERPSPTARVIAPESCDAATLSAATCLSDPRLEPPDHRRNGLAVGARGEGERHAVLEHGPGELDHVVDRRRVAAVDQRLGAHGEHQRLAGT